MNINATILTVAPGIAIVYVTLTYMADVLFDKSRTTNEYIEMFICVVLGYCGAIITHQY